MGGSHLSLSLYSLFFLLALAAEGSRRGTTRRLSRGGATRLRFTSGDDKVRRSGGAPS